MLGKEPQLGVALVLPVTSHFMGCYIVPSYTGELQPKSFRPTSPFYSACSRNLGFLYTFVLQLCDRVGVEEEMKLSMRETLTARSVAG